MDFINGGSSALVEAIGDSEATNKKDPDLWDDLTFRVLSGRNWAVWLVDGIDLPVIPARGLPVATCTSIHQVEQRDVAMLASILQLKNGPNPRDGTSSSFFLPLHYYYMGVAHAAQIEGNAVTFAARVDKGMLVVQHTTSTVPRLRIPPIVSCACTASHYTGGTGYNKIVTFVARAHKPQSVTEYC